jgi:3,4-dihydroxy-2-butanone 4-phosphate synthase
MAGPMNHVYIAARRQASEQLCLPHAADALADIAAGKFVVVTDDADRENEGDLIMAADRTTEEAMAFMVSMHTPVSECCVTRYSSTWLVSH